MTEKQLQERIRELESLLQEREQDVKFYRSELVKTNQMLEKMIASLTQDLKVAGLIQRLLTPPQLPFISGVEISHKFIPGTESGGDYFDIFEHEDRMKFGIVVTCSSGYAMSALFLTVLIQMASKIEARKGLSPEVVLKQMAQQILPQVGNKDTADVFYGIVDRRTFEFTFSSCGPLSAFHQKGNSKNWARLEPSAPPLSKTFQQDPLKQTLMLEPHDRILLCTRGVTSAKNPAGQEWGVERLLQALHHAPRSGVHELRNEILFQVERHTESREPQRDQTVLVLEVKDKLIKLAKSD